MPKSPTPCYPPPMNAIESFLKSLPGPDTPPKGSFYDIPGKRKRGAQPGNQNARKHGFYSKHLSPEQLQDFDDALFISSLDQEIALLRVKLNALLADQQSPPELLLQTINAFARLIAIQRRYG